MRVSQLLWIALFLFAAVVAVRAEDDMTTTTSDDSSVISAPDTGSQVDTSSSDTPVSTPDTGSDVSTSDDSSTPSTSGSEDSGSEATSGSSDAEAGSGSSEASTPETGSQEITCPIVDDFTGSCDPLTADSPWATGEGVYGLGSCGERILNGGTCSISCGLGYQADGNLFTCYNGVLSNNGQHCVRDTAYDRGCLPISAEQLATIPGAKAGGCGTSTAEFSTCSIDCKTGFLFNGAAEFTCANGVLTNNGQACIEQCPTPPPTGSQDQDVCPPAEDFTGSCDPLAADSPIASLEGVAGLGTCTERIKNGGTCSISCGLGYQADGNLFTCSNGVLQNNGQRCVRDTAYDRGCPAITSAQLALISPGATWGGCVTSTAENSKCSIACKNGYTLNDAPELNCINGQLVGTQTCINNFPNCPDTPDTGSQEQPAECPDNTDYTGSCAPLAADSPWATGEGVYGVGTCGQRIVNGGTCSISCGLGYQADGNLFTCHNGVLENNGQHCVADSAYTNGCLPLTAAQLFAISPGALPGGCVTSTADQSTCGIKCKAGYTLNDAAEFKCTNGVLVGSQTCTNNFPQCDAPPAGSGSGSSETEQPPVGSSKPEEGSSEPAVVAPPPETGSGSSDTCVCPPVNTCPDDNKPDVTVGFPNTPTPATGSTTSTTTSTNGDSTTVCTTTTRVVDNICKHYTLAMFGLDGSCFETALSAQIAMRLVYGCDSCATRVAGVFATDGPVYAAIQANPAWTTIAADTADAEAAFAKMVEFLGSALNCQSEGFPSIDVDTSSAVVADWLSHVTATQAEVDYIRAQFALVLQSYNIPAADIDTILAALTFNGTVTPPAGSQDAGSSDTGSSDTGSSDVGSSDSGSSDTGSSDAGSSDAGSSDVGSSDTGSSDAGSQ